VHEVSYVDPTTKTLTMCSVNMSFSHLISVRETVQYRPHPTLPSGKTLFNQRAEITALCGGWQGIKKRIEDFTVERFGQNAAKGREGFEMVLQKAREVFREQRELLAALKEEMAQKAEV
jgi:PRELI-like family